MSQTAKGLFVVAACILTPSSTFGQETRVFEEHECSFTLPGEGWEWLDPKAIKSYQALAVAGNQNGIIVMIGVEKTDTKPTSSHYESFEQGIFKSGKAKKLAAKHITFKGVPSYLIESEGPPGVRSTAWIVCANDRDYAIQVVDASGNPLANHESFIRGFAFTKEPRAMVKPNDAGSQGHMVFVYAIGFVIAVIIVVVRVFRKRA